MVHFACHGKLVPERPFETGFLSTAECAFLSVCHAAEWTDDDIPDEALHLTAAMHGDGMARDRGALRDAVQMLRRKRGIRLERWVNFVHYGG
ncbi:hypothetical protein BC827DRAFT_1253142 [Russula dissimulans]|nr:hypothetical protein BC827DRAFT_1253142 [Russula dissimulans]